MFGPLTFHAQDIALNGKGPQNLECEPRENSLIMLAIWRNFGGIFQNPMHILDDIALDQHEPSSKPIPATTPSKKARKENSTKKKKKYFGKIQEVDGNAENKASQMKKKNSGARFCVPRVKTNLSRTTAGDRNISVTPMTLLDRFREAVLRIIMISAPSIPTPHRSKPTRVNSQKYYNSTDTYHNEAVADCIEFIRTSKGNDVENGR
ncbi:BnaCnng52580D [Brassica napus]|uniref:(rape) hypothetical protein n=1 Tax=Brassica napus TaxID=3708 RepID=A0A078JGY5_BRANA|nr:unnamed protein product [Brassica napus]CDY66838.1 BnaCnng52580D [Brassica napus]